MQTKPKARHGSEQWLKDRWRTDDGRAAFGFSDAAALMGLSPYKTIEQLLVEKKTGPVVVEETWAMRRGNLLEPVLVAEAARHLGMELVTPDVVYMGGRWVGSLDAVPVRSVGEPELVCEIKTTGKYTVSGPDDLPMEWLAQGHMQAFVCDAPVVFVVFDKRQNLSVVEMPYDAAFANQINEAAEAFGAKIDANEPVPAEMVRNLTADEIARLYQPKPEGGAVEFGPEVMAAVTMLSAARAAKKKAEDEERVAKDAIAAALMDNTVGMVDGKAVVTWKQTAGRESFDSKRFKDEQPDVYAAYIKRGAPFRTMRLIGESE